MIDDKNIALLEDYLDNRLPENEKSNVQKALESDPRLREQLALIQITRESIRMSGLKQQVRAAHQEYQKKKSGKGKKIKPFAWWIGIAASISLILIIGNIWIQNFPSQIIEGNYVAYEIPTMRSDGVGANSLEIDFKNKEWSSVIRNVTENPDNQSALFFAGIASYELGNYKDGATYFEKVLKMNALKDEKKFKDESEYYLSLTLLKLKNYKEASLLIKRIKSDKNHTYHAVFSDTEVLKLRMLSWFKN